MGKARWGRPRPRRGGVLVLRRSAVADTPRRRSLHEQSACGRRALSDEITTILYSYISMQPKDNDQLIFTP